MSRTAVVQPLGHGVGVPGVAQPQVGAEQRLELDRDEAHLRGELHGGLAQVLDAVDGVRVRARRCTRRASGRSWCRRRRARRRPASVVNSRSGRSSVAAALARRAPSTCSFMPRLVRVVADRPDLLRRVAGAEFGALGDRDDGGLGAVLVAEALRLTVDQLGVSLPSGVGTVSSLRPRDLLGRAALVHVDVGGVGADHGAPSASVIACSDDDVGAGAVEDREGLGPLAEVAAEDLLQVRGVVVARRRRPGGRRWRGRWRRGSRGGPRRSCRWRSRARSGRAGAGVGAGGGVGHRGVSHRCCPFKSVAGRFHRSAMVSARSATSVNPANLALGLASRISGVTRALMTRIAAAARWG